MTSIAPGRAVLYESRGNVQTQGMVIVRSVTLLSLAHANISPDAICIRLGADYQFVMHTYDAAGVEIAPGPTTWTTSDSSLATISAAGVIHTLKGGHITVKGAALGMSDKSPVVVDPTPAPQQKTCK